MERHLRRCGDSEIYFVVLLSYDYAELSDYDFLWLQLVALRRAALLRLRRALRVRLPVVAACGSSSAAFSLAAWGSSSAAFSSRSL